jgi:hypothetical protein
MLATKPGLVNARSEEGIGISITCTTRAKFALQILQVTVEKSCGGRLPGNHGIPPTLTEGEETL